ncbi:hypothetical protein [Pseudoclavibacter sp. CFCC 14310]|uniref:hypothetical protein n=1 Tax=Pseudoclavibacter sp. CFCC 14310 TaxID=2615180 RepID=UPI001CE3FBC3|nr:hypothetical protein [Pseudoclavibacter sp. CFCC 14310]
MTNSPNAVSVEVVRSHAGLRAVAVLPLLPTLWLGMILAISFVEAPLKFQAPGITIPLGLGIGRLVFTALNIVEIALALATVVTLLVARRSSAIHELRARGLTWSLVAAVGVLLLKVVWVRPLLNARSDVIVAGGDPGPSLLHSAYVVLECLQVAALIVVIVFAVRLLLDAARAHALTAQDTNSSPRS